MTLPISHSHGINTNVDFHKLSVTNTVDTLQVMKVVQAVADVSGNIGHAQADASATGLNSLAQTTTATNSVDLHGSAAHSDSLSATNGFYFNIAW